MWSWYLRLVMPVSSSNIITSWTIVGAVSRLHDVVKGKRREDEREKGVLIRRTMRHDWLTHSIAIEEGMEQVEIPPFSFPQPSSAHSIKWKCRMMTMAVKKSLLRSALYPILRLISYHCSFIFFSCYFILTRTSKQKWQSWNGTKKDPSWRPKKWNDETSVWKWCETAASWRGKIVSKRLLLWWNCFADPRR